MIHRLLGTVVSITTDRPGIQEIEVECEGSPGSLRIAVNITDLTGLVSVGDIVELNTAAVEMGLGTGGFDFVISVRNRPHAEKEPPGHIMKLRYTPVQIPVLALESPESPLHDTLAEFSGLDETPVVCFELHSQLPAICASIHWALNECGRSGRVVYVMTDGASLPLVFSRLVPQLKERRLLHDTITAGHAFGGDFEAVNIYSAIAAAKIALKADVIVVGQGPGNVGTETALGFSGIDQGLAVNAAASLGGVPIFVPRISFADARSRHIGLSHHSLTNLTKVVRAPAILPVPRLTKFELNRLYSVLEQHNILDTHDVVTVDAEKGMKALEECGIPVTTMGRGLTAERAFFLASCASGLLAAQLVEARAVQAQRTDSE